MFILRSFIFMYFNICFLHCISSSQGIMSPTDINIKTIEKCPNSDEYKYNLNVKRHKLNRTHEALDGDIKLGIPLNEDTGIYVNIARKTGNGDYKPNEFELRDTNACDFFMKWMGNSFKEVLIKIGQPANCPLQPGNYVLKNYLVDYRDVAITLPFGDYRADLYLIMDDEKVLCTQIFFVLKAKTFNG